MIGKTLGHYEIKGLLGEGGMGVVYRATDSRLQRSVALKVLPPRLSEDRKLIERFRRESRILAELSHPHICTLLDIGTAEGVHFLVMELLEGQNVAERLRKGRLSVERVLRIGIDLSDAVDHAHRAGIVHRDIKPSNVVLTKSGAKLLDFGLARPEVPVVGPVTDDLTAPLPLTAEGSILGTLDYMSPEQVKGIPPDARSDIFSLGALLYEMLTGRRAFRGATPAERMASILNAEPAQVRVDAPPALLRAIFRCLEKDPERRWQSARDLSLELEWIATADGKRVDGGTSSPRRGWRLPLTWAVSLLLALSVGLLATRGTAPPEPRAPAQLTLELPDGASAGSVRVSPDGRRFVVEGDVRGQQGLWLRALDSSDWRRLARTEGASGPFWSPDSRRIGFFQDGKLKTVGLTGAPPKTLCDAPGPFARGSWGTRGVILFHVLEAPGQEGLFRIPEDGGEAALLDLIDGQGRAIARAGYPSFLPDGGRFLILAELDPGSGALCVGELDSGRLVDLLHDRSVRFARAEYAAPGHLIYSRDLTLFAHRFDPRELRVEGDPVTIVQQLRSSNSFSVSANGVLVFGTDSGLSQFQWKDRTGRTLAHVGQPGIYADMQLDPRAERLAVVRREAVSDPRAVWILDLERDVATPFTTGPLDQGGVLWSPEADQVFYSAADGQPPFMHRKALTGGEPEVVLPPRGTLQQAMSFAADGRELVYVDRDPVTGFDVWILSLDAGGAPEPYIQTPADEPFAAVSPDGAWIAYCSDESGQHEIYVQPYRRAGVKQRISSSGGIAPHWRQDGQELFYFGSDDWITAVPIELREGRLIAGEAQPLFATDGRLLEINPFCVRPDGQQFLVASALSGRARPTVLLGWTGIVDGGR